MSKSKKILLFLIFLGVSLFAYFYLIPSTNNIAEIEKCKDKKDSICYKKLIMGTFEKNGLDKALDLVTEIYSRDSSFSGSCHDMGHLLGSSTYKLFKEDKDFKINPKIAFCSYGFYHGFMEILASDGDVKKAGDFCKYVDSQMSKITPDATLQCYHGIGHGWVNIHGDKSLYGDDLGIVKRGLSLCEKVVNNDSELGRCATGVFNGVAIFYAAGEYELKVKKDDPMWICAKVDPKFQDACYISMNTLLFSVTGRDFAKAAKYIEKITDDEIAKHAMINLSLPFSLLEMENVDHSGSIAVCRGLQQRLVIPCFQGFAFAYMEHGEPGKEYVKAAGFCKNNGLTKLETDGCLEYIYSYLPQWYPKEKVESVCKSEGQYSDMCKSLVDKVYGVY